MLLSRLSQTALRATARGGTNSNLSAPVGLAGLDLTPFEGTPLYSDPRTDDTPGVGSCAPLQSDANTQRPNKRTTVKRTGRIIAMIAALLVLQMPLCALACLPYAAVAESLAEAEAPNEDSHCHPMPPRAGNLERSSSSSTPPAPTNSHDDCDCEQSDRFLPSTPDDLSRKVLSHDDSRRSNALSKALALAPRFGWRAETRTTNPIVPFRETDLPPPDLLLRKSSFLL